MLYIGSHCTVRETAALATTGLLPLLVANGLLCAAACRSYFYVFLTCRCFFCLRNVITCWIILDIQRKLIKKFIKMAKKLESHKLGQEMEKSNKQVSKFYFFLNSTVIYAKSSKNLLKNSSRCSKFLCDIESCFDHVREDSLLRSHIA